MICVVTVKCCPVLQLSFLCTESTLESNPSAKSSSNGEILQNDYKKVRIYSSHKKVFPSLAGGAQIWTAND